MKKLIVLLTLPLIANAATLITPDQLRKSGVVITGYEVELVPKITCEAPEFSAGDKDRDLYLDNACNIKYDPCDHDSIAEAYNQWQQSGQVCRNQINCAGINFSPLPKECLPKAEQN